jgi:hypothetical protein
MLKFVRFPFGAVVRPRGAVLLFSTLLLPGCLPGGSSRADKPLRPDSTLEKALNQITPDSLRADLSFLSSDALAGRDTPSSGLEAAAEFIASRFRGDNLQAPLNGTYFQAADLTENAHKAAERYKFKLPAGPIIARNVVAILPGSDPKLKETYVIVSAHYDHIGTLSTAQGRTEGKQAPAPGDEIYNGADDDGSGTVSVIALAQAFSSLKNKPKRSIIFMTFCGEELGLLGSRYYAEHPVVPLKDTVADINLEQIGRTDGDIKKGRASLTGYDFSTLGPLFHRVGLAFGIDVYKDRNSNRFFRASDNLNFADAGIPDLSLCTAFEFPDYHGLKDEWPKIDYPNMANVDKMVGTVVWNIANSTTAPQWNATLKQTEPYRAAAAKAHGTAEPKQ